MEINTFSFFILTGMFEKANTENNDVTNNCLEAGDYSNRNKILPRESPEQKDKTKYPLVRTPLEKTLHSPGAGDLEPHHSVTVKLKTPNSAPIPTMGNVHSTFHKQNSIYQRQIGPNDRRGTTSDPTNGKKLISATHNPRIIRRGTSSNMIDITQYDRFARRGSSNSPSSSLNESGGRNTHRTFSVYSPFLNHPARLHGVELNDSVGSRQSAMSIESGGISQQNSKISHTVDSRTQVQDKNNNSRIYSPRDGKTREPITLPSIQAKQR